MNREATYALQLNELVFVETTYPDVRTLFGIWNLRTVDVQNPSLFLKHCALGIRFEKLPEYHVAHESRYEDTERAIVVFAGRDIDLFCRQMVAEDAYHRPGFFGSAKLTIICQMPSYRIVSFLISFTCFHSIPDVDLQLRCDDLSVVSDKDIHLTRTLRKAIMTLISGSEPSEKDLITTAAVHKKQGRRLWERDRCKEALIEYFRAVDVTRSPYAVRRVADEEHLDYERETRSTETIEIKLFLLKLYTKIASLMCSIGDYDEASWWADHATTDYPVSLKDHDRSKAYFWGARAHEKLGEPQLALHDLERVLKYDPTHSYVQSEVHRLRQIVDDLNMISMAESMAALQSLHSGLIWGSL